MGRYRRVPPLEKRVFWERCVHNTSVALFSFLLRRLFRTSQAELPLLPDGAAIIAPNHRSFVDPVAVGSMLDDDLVFMMHAKYYDLPSLYWFFRASRCIVVEPGESNRRALRQGLEVLQAGRKLVIFPEGTISPDGHMQEAQPGMAWLARRSGAPVYPVYLGGTREVLTKGSKRMRLHPVVMRGGPVFSIHDFPPGRVGDQQLTQAVMDTLRELSDPSAPAARPVSA